MSHIKLLLGVVAAITLSTLTKSANAADSCATAIKKVGAWGELVNLQNETPVPHFPQAARSKVKVMHLGYGLAWAPYSTGAVIVKIRHRWPEPSTAHAKQGFPGGDRIDLERPTYQSPCDKKTKKHYSANVSIEEYVDQHFYGIRSHSMDKFHADVGLRRHLGPFLWFFTRETDVCKNTYDLETRGVFLYSDNPRVASEQERNERRAAILAKQAGFITSAFAGEAKYYKDQLETKIIPYQREDEYSCVSFNLSIPKGAGTTEIEIVDADFPVFGQNWQIKWNHN